MNVKRSGLLAIGIALAFSASAAAEQGSSRSGYSYLRDVSGDVTVDSRLNGRVDARRNMPITVGDEILVADGARAEIGLADGNVLYVGPGTKARFSSIYDQQGEGDAFSMIRLEDGSLILAAVGADQNSIPRIDTEDATVYLNPGSRARVNYDSNRGTAVVARAGTVEVRTRQGRYQVSAGEYLMARQDEEPSIERGAFSRDRFDLWAADRFQSGYETRSASARYVDQGYASDVGALDGYGDWDYSDTYNTNVWVPRVASGWTPYSYGSWYYTPIGLTWWSYDPWGWYPFHYGSWFFDASWSRWCWAPASVFSPAWVCWGFTPSWVGWCPIGFFSPWGNNFFFDRRFLRINNFNRVNVFVSINGVFSPRRVDFRGFNFTSASNFGATNGRMQVIPGSRIVDRLGTQVAISSRPIVVNARGESGVRESLRQFVREAPRIIERTAGRDSARLEPLLAREKTLPSSTVDALRERTVIAERGRLAGPGVADIAPRGALVDRARTLEMRSPAAGASPQTRGLDSGRSTPETPQTAPRSRAADTGAWRNEPGRADTRAMTRAQEPPPASRPLTRQAPEQWRGTERSRDSAPGGGREVRPADQGRQTPPAAGGDWRSRPNSSQPVQAAPRSPEAGPSSDNWRSRSPAQRVIESSVPGRRAPEAGAPPPPRGEPRSRDWQPRQVEPRDRGWNRPQESRPQSAPAPRFEGRREAPAPRFEPRGQAPAPRSEVHSAPPPQSGRAPAAPQSRGRNNHN